MDFMAELNESVNIELTGQLYHWPALFQSKNK